MEVHQTAKEALRVRMQERMRVCYFLLKQAEALRADGACSAAAILEEQAEWIMCGDHYGQG